MTAGACAVVARRGVRVGITLAAGLGMAGSLPPFGFWVLAFPAIGILWWQIEGRPLRSRAWTGWLAGLAYFGVSLFWVHAFTLPGAAIVIALEALALAAVCALTPSSPVPIRAIAFPAALVLVETARSSWPFGGLPLGGLALGQVAGPVGGSARLGGPLLLTALVGVGGVACVEGWRSLRRHPLWPAGATAPTRSGSRRRRAGGGTHGTDDCPGGRGVPGGRARHGLVACAALAVAVLVGVIGAVAPDGGPPVGSTVVAAVQGGGLRGLRKAQVDPSTVLDAQFAATATLERPGRRRPGLVLWPEDVISLDVPLAGSLAQAEMAALAQELDTTVLAGVTQTASATTFRNDEVAWAPDGRIVADYEKVHRVPFGEYVPYRSFFSHFADLSAVPLDAVPGHGSGLMVTPAGKLGAMISYEVFFADRGRSATRAGAELLVVPTNTSSYATSQVPMQEVAASRLQAIEEGRDLVQAAPTGLSAIIDNRGALHERSVLGRQQVLEATVDLRNGSTVYERFGDTPVLALAVAALVAAWAGEAGLSRRRRTGSAGSARA